MTPSTISLFNNPEWNQALWGGAGLGTGGASQVGDNLLYPALRKAAITLGPQRTPSPAQFEDAIEELNRLIGSLMIDRLFIYSRVTYQFPLTGKKTYTIGIDPAGVIIADFPVPRPQFIEEANVIISGNTRMPLFVATDQQWAKIRVQDIPNAVPQVLYNDRAYPISTLYLWGQPQPGYQLELYCWVPVPKFVAITDAVLFPPGYEDAVVLNLAVRLVSHFPLAPNIPRQVDPNLYKQAQDSMMRLMSLNAPQPIAEVPCLGTSGRNNYNVYNDTWR